jgi:hypothetical protein
MQVPFNDENVSLLDVTLESVMPGVHQRFVAMDGTLKTLDRKIMSGFEKLDTKVDGLADHFNHLQANNRERDGNYADHLRTLAVRLRAGDGSSPPPFRHQQDHNNNKSNNCQVVLATINLLRGALLMLLVVGATEWSPNIIQFNRCLTNGMGSETPLASLSLAALQPSRPVTSQNGATTSRLQKKNTFHGLRW